MRFLAFDPSPLATGLAFWDGESDKPELDRTSFPGWDRDVGEMFERGRVSLGNRFALWTPDIVGIEGGIDAPHSDGRTKAAQATVVCLIRWICHVKGIPCHSINQSSWRVSFIGRGRAKKDQAESMKNMAVRRCLQLGWDYHNNHNEAEAGGVLDHLVTKIAGETPPWRATAILPLAEA